MNAQAGLMVVIHVPGVGVQCDWIVRMRAGLMMGGERQATATNHQLTMQVVGTGA